MVTEYVCPRCEYRTRDYYVMKRHLSRVNPCPPVHSDDEPQDILKQLQEAPRASKSMACPYCTGTFSCRQSKYAHIKRFHQEASKPVDVATETLQRMDAVEQSMRRLLELTTSSSSPAATSTVVNTVNTVVNVVNNNHIVVNAFGRESLEHVTPAFIDQCVRRTDKGIVELIEKIHFDPDVRENCNIKATNAKVPLVKYNDGARWKWGRKDKLLDEIVDRGHGLMQEHFDDHEDVMRNRLSISMFEHIRKWMDKMQDRDKKTWESVITDIYVLILNASAELEGDA